jgi:hypothetical protein
MGNPIREILRTDEPCKVTTPFVINWNSKNLRALAKGRGGDALRSLCLVVSAVWDAGTISIGDGINATRWLPVTNMAGFALGDVIVDNALLDELAADTEVVLTIVPGVATTGKVKGVVDWVQDFNKAT